MKVIAQHLNDAFDFLDTAVSEQVYGLRPLLLPRCSGRTAIPTRSRRSCPPTRPGLRARLSGDVPSDSTRSDARGVA